jgi:hypothetical protein
VDPDRLRGLEIDEEWRKRNLPSASLGSYDGSEVKPSGV